MLLLPVGTIKKTYRQNIEKKTYKDYKLVYYNFYFHYQDLFFHLYFIVNILGTTYEISVLYARNIK